MFNKRDQAEHQMTENSGASSSQNSVTTPTPARNPGPTATIGASVHIKGEVQGEENLIIEGQVNGVIKLKSHTLTIGQTGKVEAEIFAHSVRIDGLVMGDVMASEQIIISKSARVQGNVMAPRISLEDGAKFRGSIDMDTDSERFRKAFNQPASISAASANAKQSKTSSDSSKSDHGTEIKPADKIGGAA